MAVMTEEEWEAAGETDQCDQCPSKPLMNGGMVAPCPFWMKRQPCPVELGMSEVV